MQKVPLNVKIFNDIYRKIESQQYKIGDMLPTEKDMESIYGTSRAPVRQALSRLESEGLIVRRPGKGTYVAKGEVTGPWITMVGFGQEFGMKLDQVACQTVAVKQVGASKHVAHLLQLTPGDPLVHTVRRRFLRGVPIYYLLHYSARLDLQSVKAAGNFQSMRYLVNRAGVEVAHVSEELAAVPAQRETAAALQVEDGYPLLQIVRLSYDRDRRPVELTEYYVRTEDWKFRVAYGENSMEPILPY